MSVIFITVVLAMGFVVFHTLNQINKDIKISNSSSKLIKDIFELNIVTNEYVMFQETRMQEQWYTKYDSLNMELKRLMKVETPLENLFILESIMTDYKALGNLFIQLVESNKQQAETDMHIRIEKILTN